MSPSFLFQKTKLHASMRGKKGKLWLMQKQSGIHKWGRYHMVKSMVAIYNSTNMICGGNQSKLNTTIYLNRKGRLANIRERSIESHNQA